MVRRRAACCCGRLTGSPPCPHNTAGNVLGDLPPRSSHSAVSVPGGVLVFGGAVDAGARSNELALLAVDARGRLTWQLFRGGGGNGAAPWPPKRGALDAVVVAGRFYVLGGYGDVDGARQYTADCWSVSLEDVPGACRAPQAVAAPPPLLDTASRPSGGAAAEAGEWKDVRRARAAGVSGGVQPQAAKRQRVAAGARAAGARRGGGAEAAAPPLPSPALAVASTAGTAMCGGRREQQQAVPPSPLQQQPRSPQRKPVEQQLQQLQRALDEQRIKAAAQEQVVASLERQNATLQDECAHWRRALELEQHTRTQASTALLQQRGTEARARG